MTRHGRYLKHRPTHPFAFAVLVPEADMFKARDVIVESLRPGMRFERQQAIRTHSTRRPDFFLKFGKLLPLGPYQTIRGLAWYVGESGEGALNGNANDLSEYLVRALRADGLYGCCLYSWASEDNLIVYPTKLRSNAKLYMS